MFFPVVFAFLGAAGSVHLKHSARLSQRQVPAPIALADVREDDFDKETMLPVTHKDFPVAVMTFAQGRNDTTISKSFQQYHEWEGSAIERICKEYKKLGNKTGWSFVDVGANIGAWMVPMASCLQQSSGGRVIAIEAMPANSRHLRAGMSYNKLDNVHLYEYAVGDIDIPDQVPMVWNLGNQGKGQVLHDKESGKVWSSPKKNQSHEVYIYRPGTTLDDIWQVEGNVLAKAFGMKVDVEGFERATLRGGAKLFQEAPPCYLFIEIKQDKEILPGYLEELGYGCHGDGGPKGFSPPLKQRNLDAFCWQKDLGKCVQKKLALR